MVLEAALWLAIAGSASAAASPTPASASPTWAEGFFAEKAHDFGPVARGGKYRHEFVLTNRLAEPVSILNVRASCGCTTGRVNATQVAPGDSAVVEAEIDTRNFVGKKSTVVFVSLVNTSGQESEARLGISVDILSDVVLNPGTIDFGTVTRGQPPTKTLTIDRLGAPGWKVERMISGNRLLTGQLVETARKDTSVQYTLSLSIKPDAPPGAIRDEIRLLTNDSETATIPIGVTALIRGDLVATPSVLALGRVTSAGGAQGRFLVRASKPFSIVSVEGGGDGFSVAPVEPVRAAAQVLTVAYRPEEGRTRGDLKHVFRVVTDLPGEPALELTVTGHVEP
jgi:hypothetical protein